MANKYLKSIDVIQYKPDKTRVTIIFKVDLPINYGIIAKNPGQPNHAGGVFSRDAFVPYEITGEGQIASSTIMSYSIQLDMQLDSDWGSLHRTGVTISHIAGEDEETMETSSGRQGFNPEN